MAKQLKSCVKSMAIIFCDIMGIMHWPDWIALMLYGDCVKLWKGDNLAYGWEKEKISWFTMTMPLLTVHSTLSSFLSRTKRQFVLILLFTRFGPWGNISVPKIEDEAEKMSFWQHWGHPDRITGRHPHRSRLPWSIAAVEAVLGPVYRVMMASRSCDEFLHIYRISLENCWSHFYNK